ncbi:hypothetical protein Tco_1057085 [Tanacetum coccineum]|uniref:Uncharacterized protein n=1 Tax=Tanacetum coccineum TaxID=301880 RepID=A0ABQ5H4C4_9ASTR
MVKLTTFTVMCKAYGGEPSVNLLRSFLNLGPAGDWLTLSNRGSDDIPKAPFSENKLDKKSFKDKVPLHPEMDPLYDQFNFLPAKGVSEGRNSPSTKFVNIDAPVIGVTPLSSVYPSSIVENVVDSDDPSYGEDEQTLVGPSLPTYREASKKLKILSKRNVASGIPRKALPPKVQKVPVRASKVAGEAFTPMDVDILISMELRDATDCHWVVAHVTPSSWNQHLRVISIEQLCDIHDRAYMRQAILDNDRAYAELERKCNEALQDLDKNPLVNYEHTLSSLRAKIEGIEFEKERLKSFKIQLLQEIDSLKQDRAAVVSKVIPDAAIKLVRSDDLDKMSGYRPLSKEEYDQAGDALANASYPFLAEYVVNPYTSL